jgi:hypothetical protein
LIFAATLLAGTTLSRRARAYRPFDGTEADVAEVGAFELELGPAHWLARNGKNTLFAPATVLNLGLAEGWELVGDFKGSVPIARDTNESAFRLVDTDVFVKHVLRRGCLQEGAGPSVAIEAGPLLPELRGESGYGAAFNVIVSERLGWLTLHLNDVASLARGTHDPAWLTTLIAEGPDSLAIRPVAELYAEHEFRPSRTSSSALAGAIWRAREGLDVDAAFRVGRRDGAQETEVRLGFTWTTEAWAAHAD